MLLRLLITQLLFDSQDYGFRNKHDVSFDHSKHSQLSRRVQTVSPRLNPRPVVSMNPFSISVVTTQYSQSHNVEQRLSFHQFAPSSPHFLSSLLNSDTPIKIGVGSVDIGVFA